MDFSVREIIFPYRPNNHLISSFSIKNIQKYEQKFKFKSSTANRFIIKPNSGTLTSGESVNIDVILHKNIVPNCKHEKLQIIYGRDLKNEPQNFLFPLDLEGVPDKNQNLNLTMVVENKETRVKDLEKELNRLKSFKPQNLESKNSGKSKIWLKIFILVVLLGFLIGFFGPIKIFKKKVIRQ